MESFLHSHNNNSYKNERNNLLTKNNSTNVPIINAKSDGNPLFLRKDYNINDFNQFEFKNKQTEKTIDINESEYKSEYKYRITRVNIDSRNRNIFPKNITSNSSVYLSNPFSLVKRSNIITINAPNHDLSINDKIILSNVQDTRYHLNSFEFIENSEYIKINHQNHGMAPFDKSTIYTPYQIKIDGINNNDLTYIQNVPLNILNDFHIIYFNTDDSNDFNPNYYYIKMPNIFAISSATYDNIYFTVTYKHLYGIPLFLINANYPITADRHKGFHIVDKIIDNNTFQIVIDSVANTTIQNCGGNYIVMNKIVGYIEGYPDNNNYTIGLNKTFYNVTKIKLLSTEFPNTEKIIKDYPESRQNNLLFWQILGDGDFVYKIAITPGNYSISGLMDEMRKKIEQTKINNFNMTNTDEIEYDRTFYADIIIDTNSSIFQINYYGQLTAVNPFRISQNSSNPYVYYIEITHPNHLLQSGTQIRILNSSDIGNVPNTIINGLHIIDSIIDKDKYTIKLPRFNPLSNDNDSNVGGGYAVNIRYPFQARLLFDKNGTVGKILGFRNVGQNNSITKWSYSLTNNTEYVNDVLVDSVGLPINNTIINNYINLNGDNYILMTNPLFKNSVDSGNLNGVFAKLLLAGLPGYILFNQFVQLGDELVDNIQSLSELEFSFYAPDGSLYAFNGIDHSFTIEIYEKINNNSHLNKKFNEIIDL